MELAVISFTNRFIFKFHTCIVCICASYVTSILYNDNNECHSKFNFLFSEAKRRKSLASLAVAIKS